MNNKLDTEDKNMKWLYIYDLNKVRFYWHICEIEPYDFGINKRTNKIWFKFLKDETNIAYRLWLERANKFRELKDR